MARQKLILGWFEGEQVEITLDGDALKCECISNLFIEKDGRDNLEYSFVALQCQPEGPQVNVFDTFYMAEELQHMQKALRQIAGDEP